MKRRHFFPALASATLAKGRLKQSCFTRVFDPNMPLDDMYREAARVGAAGFDILSPAEWPTLKKYGLIPTMGLGGGMTVETGVIQKQLHNELVTSFEGFIDTCAANRCPTAAIVGGQRKGMPYAEGANNAVAFLNRVKGRAEEKGVTLCLEVMNHKYQDPTLGRVDQICDHLDWAVDVCSCVNSPRVKILFDIYHIQITDGNIVANIRDYFPLIGHFHTAGVPGRNQIDETQELNYGFIFRTIADLGFTGYIGHEYKPASGRDPVRTLENVFAITDV
jgi:hydroxypyruvate isomerase